MTFLFGFTRNDLAERKVRSMRSHHPYARIIDAALRRYARCLDGAKPDMVLVDLWGLLELLTGTERMRYDDTVDRAAFLWPNRDFHKAVLEHLRLWRNRIVHSSESAYEMETLVFQLKRYVETLVWFHIHDGRECGGFDDACRVLAQPHLRRDLNAKLRLLRQARKLRPAT